MTYSLNIDNKQETKFVLGATIRLTIMLFKNKNSLTHKKEYPKKKGNKSALWAPGEGTHDRPRNKEFNNKLATMWDRNTRSLSRPGTRTKIRDVRVERLEKLAHTLR